MEKERDSGHVKLENRQIMMFNKELKKDGEEHLMEKKRMGI